MEMPDFEQFLNRNFVVSDVIGKVMGRHSGRDLDVRYCMTCGAVILDDEVSTHLTWHQRLERGGQ